MFLFEFSSYNMRLIHSGCTKKIDFRFGKIRLRPLAIGVSFFQKPHAKPHANLTQKQKRTHDLT